MLVLSKPWLFQSLVARTAFLIKNMDICAMKSKLSHCSLDFYYCANHRTKLNRSLPMQDLSWSIKLYNTHEVFCWKVNLKQKKKKSWFFAGCSMADKVLQFKYLDFCINQENEFPVFSIFHTRICIEKSQRTFTTFLKGWTCSDLLRWAVSGNRRI